VERPPATQRKADFLAAVASAACGGEANVVDFGIGAPVRAAGDGDFEFAGEIVELGIATEFLINGEREGSDVGNFMGMNAGKRAASDIPGHISTGAGRAESNRPEALENFRNVFDSDPVKLNVLADGDICHAVTELFGELCDETSLFCGDQTVGDTDADHEERNGLAFPVFAAGNSRAVALRINAPGAEVGSDPFRRNGIEALASEGANFVEMVPGVLCAFEAFDALGFAFLDFGYFGH